MDGCVRDVGNRLRAQVLDRDPAGDPRDKQAARDGQDDRPPRAGAAAAAPKRLAPIDLVELRERIASTIEKAKAEDPRELRRQIAELKRQLGEPRPAPEREILRVPIVIDSDIDALRSVAMQLQDSVSRVQEALHLAGTVTTMAQVRPLARTLVAVPDKVKPKMWGSGEDSRLAGGERRILTALAQYQGGRSLLQVALLTGYAKNGGGFNNYVSALRSRGLIRGGKELLRITEEGAAALGAFDALPLGRELFRHWCSRLGKAERSILEALSKNGGADSKSGVAETTGYAENGGGFNNALSRLRTLELISGRDEVTLAEELR